MKAEDWPPSASPQALRLRAALYARVRAFFAARGVLEVETPILSQAGNTDPNIRSFRTCYRGPIAGGTAERWLRTSPEYPLKRLLAAGIGDCYELGRVFRDGEAGRYHNPEFTLLEWYRVGWDHQRLMREVAELVIDAASLVGARLGVEHVSYRTLYHDVLGLDPFTAPDAALRAALADAEIAIDPQGLSRDDWLDLLMTHRLQPHFSRDRLLFVYDYPASQCALARLYEREDGVVAERFELYWGPYELANGYHELADAQQQRVRFEQDLLIRRARGEALPPMDAHLLAALAQGLPECAGVALGMDRLLMGMTGDTELGAWLSFEFARA